MAAASINEETHRETQQTRTETQEKQRKSFISDRAEWSEARPPLSQRSQGPCYKPRAQMHIHPHTHTHTHRQTDAHQIHEDTRRHAKSLSLPSGRPAKKDSYCFALPVHLLRQVSFGSFSFVFYKHFCIGGVPHQTQKSDSKMLPSCFQDGAK